MNKAGRSLICFLKTFLICRSYLLFIVVPLCEPMSTNSRRIVYSTSKDFFKIMPSELPAMNDSSDTMFVTPGENSKRLGDKCSSLYDCSSVNAVCSFGVCTCSPGYYKYRSSVYEPLVCQPKRKFNETCDKDDDCIAHDVYSLCMFQRCQCKAHTRFVKSQMSRGKCYKIGLKEGQSCEIDEQCHAPVNFRCKCMYSCQCHYIDNENLIKIENIVIGISASMAFLIGMQLVIFCIRKRLKARQQSEQQHLDMEEISEADRFERVVSLPPEVVSSHITSQTIPYRNHNVTSVSEAYDLPPRYEDVCKNGKHSLIRSPPPFGGVK